MFGTHHLCPTYSPPFEGLSHFAPANAAQNGLEELLASFPEEHYFSPAPNVEPLFASSNLRATFVVRDEPCPWPCFRIHRCADR